MFQKYLIQVRHECRRSLGMMLSTIRLHRVEFLSVGGVDVVRKQRRRFSSFVILLGNHFQRLTGSPVFALSSRQWLEWERAIEMSTRRHLVLLSSPDSFVQNSSLWCRRVPGVSLSQVLKDNQISLSLKLAAIRWALAALRGLHANDADWGQGIHQSISHGDATANNVIVDLNHGSACWIDFDTRHHPGVADADRHTDDLRALIGSSAIHLPVTQFPELAGLLVTAGIDPAILGHFRQRLTSEWISPTVFQLAQAPLRWSVAQELRTVLLRVLDAG